jgi:hypothetical protein
VRDLVDLQRVLDHWGLDIALAQRWGGGSEEP